MYLLNSLAQHSHTSCRLLDSAELPGHQIYTVSITGLSNLWDTQRFPWHMAFTAVPISCYFFRPTNVSILWRICAYIHISDCVEIIYKLLLLPNNTASETFLYKLGVKQSVDWIFITRTQGWQ